MSVQLRKTTALVDALRTLKVSPDAMSTPEAAAQAVLAAGGGDVARAAARALLDRDAHGIAKIKRLLDAGATKPGTPATSTTSTGANKLSVQIGSKLATRPPEAQRAAAIYLPEGKRVGRPLERFLVHVGRLHEELSGPHASEMLDDVKVGESMRKHMFMLEELVRFYAERGPEKNDKKMEKARLLLKELEDRTGWYGDAVVAGDEAAHVHGFPKEARDRIEKHVGRSRDDLTGVLDGKKGWVSRDAGGWRPDKHGKIPALQELVDVFAQIDFGSEKQDAAFVKSHLAKLCTFITNRKLDMGDLENGIHQLRRDLRRVGILLLALDGMVRLDENKSAGDFDKLKSEPVAQSAFAKLPVTDHDKQHIEIPWSLFLGLSKAIAELGAIKDRGHAIENLAVAIERSDDVPAKEARALAEKLLDDPGGLAQVVADASKLHAALDKSGLLPALRDAFAHG